MRRNTLAQVSRSEANSRWSNVGAANKKRTTMGTMPRSRVSQIPVADRKSSISGRPSVNGPGGGGGGRPSAMGRPSMTARPSMGGGKLSMNGGRPSGVAYGRGGSKADPRPISDIEFRNSCIRDVIFYLTANGYDQSISPKMLSSPSAKDFVHIVTFLFKKLVPNFRFEGRPEDEIPLICKQLGYPFGISRGSLLAVGTPHTWPSLLAMLQWLVELIRYREGLESNPLSFEDFEGAGGSAGIKFDKLVRLYAKFMQEDDSLESDMAREFAERNKQIEEDVQRLLQEIATLQQKLEALMNSETPVVKHRKQVEALMADKDKFVQLLENLRSHKAHNELKLRELTDQLKAREAETAQAEREAAALREQVSRQTLSVGDVERMARERQSLESELAGLGKRVKEVEKSNWDKESECSQQMAQIEEWARSYTERVKQLRLPQHVMRDGEGKPLFLSVQVAGLSSPNGSVFSQDLSVAVQPALAQLKQIAIDLTRKSQDALFAIQEELAKVEEQLGELRDEKGQIERQLRRLESNHRVEKQRTAHIEQQLAAEIEKKEQELEQLRAAVVGNLTSHDDCEALTKELEAIKAAHKQEEGVVQAQIAELEQLVRQHKQHMATTLERLQGVCGAALQQVCKVKVPKSVEEL